MLLVKNLTVSILIFFCCHQIMAQEKKTIQATRITEAPKIDGFLDDAVWGTLPFYGNFNMYEPGNEGVIPESYKSEIKLAYDDKAVYIAAYLSDPNPDAISSQFSQRDNVNVQADQFMVALNTYNDGLNETRFFVTSAGTIGDSRVTSNNQDFGYNTVFECRISKDENGWYAEYKIPYNALRFPEVEVQNWSVNFYRRIVSRNETHTWNLIKNSVGKETQYNGIVEGVRDIDPPVRLTFYPFVQGSVTNFDSETETNLSAGMDIKYGLSDSFTLDATLIPDFGQAGFDDVTLNLGPFEQTFAEQRPFFTEGTDLFEKGNIFFSRRVGNAPIGNVNELNDDEIITEFPERVNLLNAIKISGRTKEQLGVGFFNAVTQNTFATISDTLNGNIREVLVEPISNYNIVVLDQQFNGNSSISLINTNVVREGNFRDANTSAFVFDIADKGNNFRASGRTVMSNVNTDVRNVSGFLSEIDIFKIKGNFRYRIGHDFANKTYDINDFGINFTNNFNDFVAGASYEIFEPVGNLNRYKFEITARHQRRYDPSVQTRNLLILNLFFVTKNRLGFGGEVGYSGNEDDYFEPRVEGRYVTFNKNLFASGFISTDYRKKFALDVNTFYGTYYKQPTREFGIEISPRYRFSNQLLVIASTGVNKSNNDIGFVSKNNNDIFFGQRDITNVENTLTATYNFDPFKAIDLRFRNFWSTADYNDNQFSTLNDNGSRTPTEYDITSNDPNRNFNIWNLDLSFRWRFAPGSEASLLYRNQLFNFDNAAALNYGDSLKNLFDQPQQNTLSLRVTYFIDYNNIASLLKKDS